MHSLAQSLVEVVVGLTGDGLFVAHYNLPVHLSLPLGILCSVCFPLEILGALGSGIRLMVKVSIDLVVRNHDCLSFISR